MIPGKAGPSSRRVQPRRVNDSNAATRPRPFGATPLIAKPPHRLHRRNPAHPQIPKNPHPPRVPPPDARPYRAYPPPEVRDNPSVTKDKSSEAKERSSVAKDFLPEAENESSVATDEASVATAPLSMAKGRP